MTGDRAAASRRHALQIFAVLAVIVAAVAGAVSVVMLGVLRSDEGFQRFVKAVVAQYSPDGLLSPAGLAIIQRAAAIVVWTSGLLMIGASMAALLLRHLLRSPDVQDVEGREGAPQEEAWWHPKVTAGLAVGLLVVGAAIRAPRLFTSLFYDEIFSIQHFAALPWYQIPLVQEGFNNHPLNSLWLWAISHVSSAEAMLRLPAYLAGVGSLWLLFQVGRHLGGPLAGLLSLWLAALSSYHLWYSTLARGYMPGLFLVLLGLVVFLRAGAPPSRRARWLFGLASVLASWAVPTAALVPLLLAGWLLLGAVPGCRRWLGIIDPCSPTGLAWLLTTLWVLVIVGVTTLPMAPMLIRLKAESPRLLGVSWSGVANWLGVFDHGPLLATAGLGLVALGLAALLRRTQALGDWRRRWLVGLFTVSLLLAFGGTAPARTHVIAFGGVLVLAALGVQWLLRLMASMVPADVRPWVRGVVPIAVLVAVMMTSWGEVVQASRGIPRQDVRGAVQVAESVLPDQGVIVTSGFAEREIAYYATRPVRWLSPTADPATWLASKQPFCYFRLFAEAGGDLVFNAFDDAGLARALRRDADPLPHRAGPAPEPDP